ncbi:S41 family peptidase [Leeuwenhoekiella parthenopeia]|uniref:Tail specific protease domain-containing protein n=1 Tax=Leeuwenhoekiella parthenopeia TaxID=2890320 RepID=A0ABS8H1G9_9FLAO|nr:S41 family peptidase [Leeuwenhoekiella parthenopeia]MCC4214673.1 hypothetical protein [Leeuwenhoekiella parthenopeia]
MMKTSFKLKIALYFVCLILLSTCSLFAQDVTCDCKKDIGYVIEELKKTPAYKNDYRSNEQTFDAQIKPIISKASSQTPLFDCYTLLVQTLQLVNDGHNSVYGLQDFDSEKLKDQDKLAEFKKTAFYSMYPDFSGDLDELTQRLSKKSNDSMEGIYYAGSRLQIGVVADSLSDSYKMIVLNSQLPIWENGEQLGVLKKKANNQILAVIGNYTTKTPISITTGYAQREFMSLKLTKDTTQTQFWQAGLSDKTYYFEQLNSDLSYLKIGSFSGFYPTLGEAEAFYKDLQERKISKNIIIDLRSNGGGGDRNSDILFDFLEKVHKGTRIYALVNQNTASNAEQFVLRLKELDHVTVLGDRTKGMIAYELKGAISTVPSGFFKLYLTSKKHKTYLPYEGVGVVPDVFLDYSKDWITQTQSIILQRTN